MDHLRDVFGSGTDLTVLQMSLRAFMVFIIGLGLIKLSGKRSLGMHMPLDTIITILLGAILARAVSGASPFIPTIAACIVMVLLHRFFSWLSLYSESIGFLVKGKHQILFDKGHLYKENMKNSLLSEKDLEEGIRLNSNLENIQDAQTVYLERNGKISIVKKKSPDSHSC